VVTVQVNSLKLLAVVVAVFFFASNLSSVFLPVFFRDEGLSMVEIIEILLVTFLVTGLLPMGILKVVKNFERVIVVGIFSTMVFYIALIYIKTPIVLGLTYGTSLATFWPSFNLLQFKLSESTTRARVVSFYSAAIPSVAGITAPAVGGFIIENFGFPVLFAFSIVLYLAAFLFAIFMPLKPEFRTFSIPRKKIFTIFFATFILLGLSEAYWLAYPLFVHKIAGTTFEMGLVYTFSALIVALIVALITFLVNWLSDVKKSRAKFAIIGAMLYATWCFVIPYVSASQPIVLLSFVSGLAGACYISWFALYGDSFVKEDYATILVMMEVGLMIGRIMNLAPTYLFVSEANYVCYFVLLGFASLILVPFYAMSERNQLRT